jgi:hypothetical protein
MESAANLCGTLSLWDAPIDTQTNWETLFAGYAATVDAPGYYF